MIMYLYVHEYTYVCACRQTCMSINVYMHVCRHTYMNPYVFVDDECRQTCMYICMDVWYRQNFMYVCAYIYTCILAYSVIPGNMSFNQ